MFADLHHHLIHDVDDGPRSFEQTQKMIARAWENGVTDLVATSHAQPGRQYFPLEKYRAHLDMAREWCAQQKIPLKIYSGSEMFYTEESARLVLEGKIPTLAEGRTVLVEFSPAAPFDHIQGAVRKLGNAGFSVVIAHAERYQCLRQIQRVASLREELGAMIQINANTFLSPGGFFARRWLRRMMEADYCDLAATDAHDTEHRPCRMRSCYEALAAEWGEETARQLCVVTPRRLLGLRAAPEQMNGTEK